MGLGSTAKKIQIVSERAEQMYKQVQELQERIFQLEEEVDDTHDTVRKLDHQLTEQRALLIAIADELDLDGEEILAQLAIDDAEELAAEAEATDEAAESVVTDAEADAPPVSEAESTTGDGATTSDGGNETNSA